MPIRINLLAEARELEDLRRRDPVKRVIFAGAILIVLILAWSSSLMVKAMIAKGEVSRLESDLNSRTNQYRQILLSQSTLVEDRKKLELLAHLANERFLVGNLLNALQQSTVDNVQLVQLKLAENYVVTKEVKPKPGQNIKPKPATSKEKITITLSAKDSSGNPGDGVAKFQKALSSNPYFQEVLGKTNGFRLTNLGAPQVDTDGRSYLLLTLDGQLPEKTR